MSVLFRYNALFSTIQKSFVFLAALVISSKSYASDYFTPAVTHNITSVIDSLYINEDNTKVDVSSTAHIRSMRVEGRGFILSSQRAVTAGFVNNLEIEVNSILDDGIYSGIYAQGTEAIAISHMSGDFILNLNSANITSHQATSLGIAGEAYVYGTAITLNAERGADSDLSAYINTQAGTYINGDIKFGNNVNAVINNAGTINGDISNNVTVAIDNRSAINGNVFFGYGDNSSLTNEGDILGSIDMSSAQDAVLRLNDGSVTGDISSMHESQTINVEGGLVTGNVNFAGRFKFVSSSNNIVGNVSTNGGKAVLDLAEQSNNVTGGLTLASGDNISIAISDHGAGKITTTQAANIAENVSLDVAVDRRSYLANGAQYVLVDGGEGSTIHAINDSNIDVNNSNSNTAFRVVRFSTSVSESGDDLLLNVSRAKAEEVTKDRNAQDAYKVINNIGENASGALQELQIFVDNASSRTDVERALKSIAPQDESSTKLSNIAALTGSVSTAENRMESFHVASVKAMDRFKSVNANNAKLGMSSGDKAVVSEVWGQTFGTRAKQKEINQDGYDASSVGFAFGVDREFGKNTRAGIAVSYADSRVESKDKAKSTQIDSYQVNLYAGQSLGKYFVDGIVGATFNDYDSSRHISAVGSTAHANYQGQSYIAKVRAGTIYNNVMNSHMHVIPEVSTTFINSYVESYQEQGADTLNLNVSGGYDEFLEGRIGVAIEHDPIMIKALATTPRLNVSYGYNFLNQNQTVISNFVGQSTTFNTISSHVDPSSIKWGMGLDVQNSEDVTTSLDYTNERRGNYVSHVANAKVKYKF